MVRGTLAPRIVLAKCSLVLLVLAMSLACGVVSDTDNSAESESAGVVAATPTPADTPGAETTKGVVTSTAIASETSEPEASTEGPVPTTVAASTPAGAAIRTDASVETDRDALVALFNATNGPNWTNNDNWLSDQPLGQWHGVRVDEDGRVVSLSLAENQLRGEIPPILDSLE